MTREYWRCRVLVTTDGHSLGHLHKPLNMLGINWKPKVQKLRCKHSSLPRPSGRMLLASSSLMVLGVPWPMWGHCHLSVFLSLGSCSSRIHSPRHTSLICKDIPQITSQPPTPFPFFPGSPNKPRAAQRC